MRVSILLAAALGCTGSIDEPTGTPGPGDGPGVPSPSDDVHADDPFDPDREHLGGGDTTPGASVRRLSADQLAASLQIATGQRWAQYERFAEALGRPDLEEVTTDDRSIGASFEKLAEDAARDTCMAAVEADATAPEPAILRHATLAARDDASLIANLKYLVLRFWGERVVRDDDERLVPWLELLRAGAPSTDAAMAARWQAVCVGLVTHPNFLTY